MPYYINGVGLVKVREHWERNIVDLALEAAEKAIEHSGLSVKKIDRVIVSNSFAQYINTQAHLAPLIADYLGLSGKPAISVELGNASGGAAIHTALKEIAAGSENVLVIGVEKPSDVTSEDVVGALATELDWEFITALGITSEGIQGIMAHLYMQRFNAPRENIAAMSVLSHSHAAKSPHALYPFPTTPEKVLSAPKFADPLTMLEVAGKGDGAAAIVLSASNGEVEIAGSAIATDRYRIFEREDILELRAVSDATMEALNQANISHSDINILEIHDATSIAGVLQLEALGFAERGEGHKMITNGVLDLNGKLPTNTFGGSKARGDPFGATGIYQVGEIYLQLIGEAGFNQVENAKIGLSLITAGVGSSAVVNVLRKR